ncbi:hypothetical protein S7711_10703 [Stachybotrys chartarum IBT 7711]|uniref:Uncharacterized protein n=1 Tax=Stachybotrys chartarum (strain CBS 109288 / IBT 7711) TaxID=1280523 RepID=A0A084AXX0_STACB|nr:hypothetical protein S7711_10703 [Stachybotrys chartarum IBT 7711]KFA46861.1 hypothetical protein S40293_10962 [Stachybotrys chartarum IBT 40293]
MPSHLVSAPVRLLVMAFVGLLLVASASHAAMAMPATTTARMDSQVPGTVALVLPPPHPIMLTPSARDVFGAAVDAERISDAMLSVAFGAAQEPERTYAIGLNISVSMLPCFVCPDGQPPAGFPTRTNYRDPMITPNAQLRDLVLFAPSAPSWVCPSTVKLEHVVLADKRGSTEPIWPKKYVVARGRADVSQGAYFAHYTDQPDLEADMALRAFLAYVAVALAHVVDAWLK